MGFRAPREGNKVLPAVGADFPREASQALSVFSSSLQTTAKLNNNSPTGKTSAVARPENNQINGEKVTSAHHK